MLFGLCNVPARFQRCMMSIFTEMIEDFMEVFMDDCSVYGFNFKNFIDNLCKVLARCEEKKLTLNWEKCHFMVQCDCPWTQSICSRHRDGSLISLKLPYKWFVLSQIRGRVVVLRDQIYRELRHTKDLEVMWLS